MELWGKSADNYDMKRNVLVILVMCGLAAAVWADVPPAPAWGADAVPDLYAPNLAGPGAFSTSSGGAVASAVNPAQAGEAQRIVFDIGYLGLAGLYGDAKEESTFGNAIEMGALFPTRYGVFGGTFRFIQSPFDVNFPIKSAFSGNLSAAKEIYPRMSVGMGLNFGAGSDKLWMLSADLGFYYRIGTVGPFENFTWAVVLGDMGKSWTPSWFTPQGGVSFDLIRIHGAEGKNDPFALNTSFDLGLPSIVYFPQTSLFLKLGLKAIIAEMVTVSVSWPGGSGLNAREVHDYGADWFNPVPSVGIGFNINLPSGGKNTNNGKLPTDGELAIDTAFKPLYKGVTALGAGATWTVGIADKKPPHIEPDYPETAYFSPNNDGKADYLEFPISITDERYVDSWVWEIFDEEGNPVRSYRNKELRPETQGFKNFFNRLFAVKQTVEIPPSFRWDGIGDSGELNPDGTYYFTITATDDSGNTITTEKYAAVLKNAPPEVTIEVMEDAQRVFSPGGGGSKNSITFNLETTYEDAWESGIYNSVGEKIRTFEPESGSPAQRTWDGKDDSGGIVGDGVYSYRIEATDRALNYGSDLMENIIVNTIRPTISVIIADPWFSPNGDGIKDTLQMDFNVPVKDEVTDWTLQIRDSANAVKRTISGTGAASTDTVSATSASTDTASVMVDKIAYNGQNDAGAILGEGRYVATLSVKYINGYTANALSPPFTLKLTPPSAQVSSDFTAFSPNYGGVQSEMLIRQQGTPEELWIGEIRRAGAPATEKAVRSFRFNGKPSAELKWDGHGESGTFAADGEYTYEVYATDMAGNTGRSNMLRFRMSTVDTPVMITTDLRAFSPNGDKIKDVVNMNPQIKVRDGIVTYKVEVQNNAGMAVRTFEGRGMPPTVIQWDGKTNANAAAPEGMYKARLELRYEQGNNPNAVSLPFELDITPPRGTVSAPFTIFSPNGQRNTIPFSVSTEANDEWEAAIIGPNGNKVKTWTWTGKAPEVVWDGKDNAGNNAADANYQFTLESTDLAGNSARYSIPSITLDARVPRLILTSSATGIAPKTDQSTDLVRFGIMCSLQDGIENWTLELKDDKGGVVKSFNSQPAVNGKVAPPPTAIGWTGLTEGGGLREGRFTPTMKVNYLKGDTVTAETASILVHVTGPELTISYRPQYFSPDNDGVDDELFISLGAKSQAPIANWFVEIREPVAPNLLFYRVEGKGSPSGTIIWDGRSNKGELVQAATDYPVRYTATDTLGNSSTIESMIGVDVLVIRDGDRLKIQVPSIVFRENAADFNGIPADRAENNIRVLRRIAEILNKFRDYKVQVEGHANPVARTVREEQNELQPLSDARAKMVMNMLIEFGVSRSRLSAIGMGGTHPVVKYEDRDNWWKNRRVEFILIK